MAQLQNILKISEAWCSLLTAFLVCAIFSPACDAPADAAPNKAKSSSNGSASSKFQWAFVAKGELAEVYEEKKLYRRENSHFFYTHLQIRNKYDQDIELDLSQGVIEPFNWRVARTEDEPEMVYDGPDISSIPRPRPRKDTTTDSSKHLQIGKGKCLDYYTCFTASGSEEIERQLKEYKSTWIIVTNLGAIDLSAGKKTELIDARNIKCGLDSRLGWSKIPAASKVMGEL